MDLKEIKIIKDHRGYHVKIYDDRIKQKRCSKFIMILYIVFNLLKK